jgi:methylated-DNA-protein-cysteine methyltransferase-like protein
MRDTFQKIYDVVRKIPFGRVTTYGQIARIIGNPRLAQVVGFALAAASDELPCHRVVNRFGGLSDAFQPMGRESHRLLLEREGVVFLPAGTVDMERFMWYGPDEPMPAWVEK